MSKQTVAKKDVEDYVASVGMVDLPVEVANTDDVDTAEIQPARDYDSGFGARTLASRSGMTEPLGIPGPGTVAREEIAPLRKQLAKVTAERDRLKQDADSQRDPFTIPEVK